MGSSLHAPTYDDFLPRLESDFDPFISRMRARESAKERDDRSRLHPEGANNNSVGSGREGRISWGEAALSAGIKDEKVRARLISLFFYRLVCNARKIKFAVIECYVSQDDRSCKAFSFGGIA